jgi:hypothetical protein
VSLGMFPGKKVNRKKLFSVLSQRAPINSFIYLHALLLFMIFFDMENKVRVSVKYTHCKLDGDGRRRKAQHRQQCQFEKQYPTLSTYFAHYVHFNSLFQQIFIFFCTKHLIFFALYPRACIVNDH